MYIVPISSAIHIEKFQNLSQKAVGSTAVDPGNPSEFKQIFQDVLRNVEQTEAVARSDAYRLSIGEMDDLHTMTINATKADAALQTMINLRNKLLDAYSEVMRTNL